jgi:hypothetical protein
MKIVITNVEVKTALRAEGRRIWTGRRYLKTWQRLYAAKFDPNQVVRRGTKRHYN